MVFTIITKDGKSKVYYCTKNQLGSITLVTDEKGKLVEEYKYDVFGKAYIRNGKSENWREFKESKIGNTGLFTGREYDREIGLYYYRARYYSAELGRFISRDPIGQVDDVNLYGYVGNNSVNFVDPSGLEKVLVISFFQGMDKLLYNTDYWEGLYADRYIDVSFSREYANNKDDFNNILNNYKNSGITDIIIAGHGNPGAMKFGDDRSSLTTINNDYSIIKEFSLLKSITLASCSTGEIGGSYTFDDIEGNTYEIIAKNNNGELTSYANELSIFLNKSFEGTINVYAADGYYYDFFERVNLFTEGNIISFPTGEKVRSYDFNLINQAY